MPANLFSRPYRIGGNPIIRNGPEAYDANKAGPGTTVKVYGGTYVRLYEAISSIGTPISGSDGNNNAAYATSADGKTWTKQGVVLSANSVGWEQYELCPTALVWDDDNAQWVLYYHGGNNTGPRSIGRATSPGYDSILTGGTWTKDGGNPIFGGTAAAWDDGWTTDCKVIRVSATDWRLWYRGGTGDWGYATSTNGISWTKDGTNPTIDVSAGAAWENTAIEAFCPVRLSATEWIAYYIGANATPVSSMGVMTSTDGITWYRDGGNPVLLDATDDDISDSVDAMLDVGLMRLYYGLYDLVGDTLRGNGYAEAFSIGVPIVDNFNRPDSTGLGTPSGGGTWTTDWAGGGDGAPNVVSGRGSSVTPAAYYSTYHSGSLGPNCYCQCEFVAGTGLVGLMLMTSNAGTPSKNGYGVFWDVLTTNFELYRVTGASEVVIGSGSVAFPGAGSLFRLRLNLTNVVVEYSTTDGVSWTTVSTVADTTHRGTATKPAFLLSSGTTVAIDNFAAATIQDVLVESFRAIPFY